jgi:hypothetical protein
VQLQQQQQWAHLQRQLLSAPVAQHFQLDMRLMGGRFG